MEATIRGGMAEVLFIKTSSLGDVVHQLPAITDASRALPGARLSWVVEEAFAPLARLHPAVAEVIPVATRRWRNNVFRADTWREIAAFRARLRERAFDVVIDTQGLLRSAVIAFDARGESHGYDAESIREPLASQFYAKRHRVPRILHAIVRNRRLTSLALGYDFASDLEYGLAKASTSDGPFALLLHGTSRTVKEWPERDWIGLGKMLRGRGYQVLFPSGTAREQERSARLATSIPGSRTLDRRPLNEIAELIASASLVVGVDTGLLHLAAAFRVPLVGIYTASDPALTGPVGNGPIATLGGKGEIPVLTDVLGAVERLVR